MEQRKRKSWTEQEERVVLSHLQRNPENLKEGFARAATQLGRTIPAVSIHYYKVMSKRDTPVSIVEEHTITPTINTDGDAPLFENKGKPWTDEEDAIVLNQVRAFPQNLAKCFLLASEDLKRSPKSIAYRWYRVLSKKEGVCEFGTISSRHFSRNRKNGEGVPITPSIWRRFLNLIQWFL